MRKLAYEIAVTLSKRIPKSWNSLQNAGKQWLCGFILRRKELSLQNPEAISSARATAFNYYAVGEFFTNLREVRLRLKFQSQNIYNINETGLTTVPSSTN